MEFINPWLALIGLALPLVVAAVTKSNASSTLKGWTLAILSGVGAALAELVESGVDFAAADVRELANNTLLIFASSVIAYKGGLVSGAAKEIAGKTADTGLGGRERDPETGRFV